MYLGLKTGPLRPILWYCFMGALLLYSSSRLPPNLAPNTNWIQKNRSTINLIEDAPYPVPSFICLKIPGKRTPSMLPNRCLFGESCPFPEPYLTCLLNSSIYILLIKINFTLLSKALGKERPHVPQNGDPMESDTNIQSCTWHILWRPK
jgi:hypothetical protein